MLIFYYLVYFTIILFAWHFGESATIGAVNGGVARWDVAGIQEIDSQGLESSMRSCTKLLIHHPRRRRRVRRRGWGGQGQQQPTNYMFLFFIFI
jgi:hypothetical protein